MAWQPVPESLSQLAACLKDSLSGWDKAAQKQAETMLAQAKQSPDINNYLIYLFSSSTPPPGLQCTPEEYHIIRSAAAIMLKNNVRLNYKQIPESSLNLIKMALPMILSDKNAQMRNYAGNTATELIRGGGIASWSDLLNTLLGMIGEGTSASTEAQEGAIVALAKICEDNTKMLEREVNGQRPLNIILPKLIAATKSSLPRVRAQALTAINVFTPRKSQAMVNHMDDLLQQLFSLANDSNADVRRQVCRAFVQLVETRPDKIHPFLPALVDYILLQQKGDDEEVACEAAEFWLAVAEHDSLYQFLSPYVEKIIPVLLQSMVYSGEDIALLGGASDDEEEEDREEDLKPTFAKNLSNRATTNGGGSASQSDGANAYQKLANMEDELEEGEIEDLTGGDDSDPEEKWTLRKCSAAALDSFAQLYRDLVFKSILPYLTKNLKHEDWPYREAAVLALGAVADGCMEEVTPHLPELIPYLITLLNDSEPVVRQITCWTLGRYSGWAASLTDPAQKQTYFEPMMEGILVRMLDKNKKVQEAGASAFATLEENAGRALEPYSGPIVRQFVLCFSKYKDKNMYILYDCVQTLAEHIGPGLAQPELVNQLMPALIGRWQKVLDQSRELFPLHECLSYVATALRGAFEPYARPIFSRCLNIIQQNLEAAMINMQNPAFDVPDKDFLVTGLDLLSSIIQALDKQLSAQLLKEANTPFFQLLNFCLEDRADEVRQSAYALLGDCAKFIFEELRPALSTTLPVLMKQLELDDILDEEIDTGFSAVNNACWASGEISLRYGDGLAPFTLELSQRFVELITNPGIPKSVVENAAIALGRLGYSNGNILAPHLANFAEDFLVAMAEIEPSDEKTSALMGFTAAVEKNPMAMEKSLLRYFTAVAQCRDAKSQGDLNGQAHELFQKVLGIYQQIMPQFSDFVNRLEPDNQQALRGMYSL